MGLEGLVKELWKRQLMKEVGRAGIEHGALGESVEPYRVVGGDGGADGRMGI